MPTDHVIREIIARLAKHYDLYLGPQNVHDLAERVRAGRVVYQCPVAEGSALYAVQWGSRWVYLVCRTADFEPLTALSPAEATALSVAQIVPDPMVDPGPAPAPRGRPAPVAPQEVRRSREHVRRRLAERYGFTATNADIAAMTQALVEGKADDLGVTPSNPRAHLYRLAWRGIIVYPIFDPRARRIFTVLDPRQAESTLALAVLKAAAAALEEVL